MAFSSGQRCLWRLCGFWFLGLTALPLLMLGAAWVFQWTALQVDRLCPAPAPVLASSLDVKFIPTFEIYPEPLPAPVEDLQAQPAIETPGTETDERPWVAIIIDDLGYSRQAAQQLVDLEKPLTFSVLPFSPRQSEVLEIARVAGLEVMLHLPMEPLEYPRVQPGPGALLADMSNEKLLETLAADLATVTVATGVNNHMGSRLTSMPAAMTLVLGELQRQGLFFIDSLTTGKSCAVEVARKTGIVFGQRNVFLDHDPSDKSIRRQLTRLYRVALRQGQAIGIGHPYPSTLRVLREQLPAFSRKAKLVPASELVAPLREENTGRTKR